MEGGAAGAGASSNHVADPDTNDAPHTGDEDEVAEVDPEGRYYRCASGCCPNSSCYG